ncbi:MAG: molecular chaperone TorD family protein [Planctomycetota bacterium]
MNKGMCTESVSLDDKRRLLEYKTLSMAFSYPDDSFFSFFPELAGERANLIAEYDRLFRANETWLYGTEHLAKNEFQRTNYLSDIMGFYRAFGVAPHNDRPDAISNELEFMHYLIFKQLRGQEDEKISICLDAQRKFFSEHLYPAAKKIAKAIISRSRNDFYLRTAQQMLEFLKSEEAFLEQ